MSKLTSEQKKFIEESKVKAEKYHSENQEELENAWEIHKSEGEWGSGEDKIVPCETMFWEFVSDRMEGQNNE